MAGGRREEREHDQLVAWPGGRARWGPFDELPSALAAVAQRLDALRREAREHPRAALRLTVEGRTPASGPAPEPPAGRTLAFGLHARGTEPLTVTVRPGRVRARVVVAGAGSGPLPLLWVREAAPVSALAPDPATLGPGESLRFAGEPSRWPAAPGPYRADGFVEVLLALPAEEGELGALLAAGPAQLRG